MGERRLAGRELLAADQVQRYDWYKVLVPQIGAIPLLRHCVDEAHEYQERDTPAPEPIETFDFISSGRG